MYILILVLLKEKSDGYGHRWPVALAGRKRGDRAPRLRANGKVQKFVLREQAIKALGLEEVAKTRTA